MQNNYKVKELLVNSFKSWLLKLKKKLESVLSNLLMIDEATGIEVLKEMDGRNNFKWQSSYNVFEDL